MESLNKYIGDDKMQKMLEHYHCEMPLNTIKMRFAGAICSPNLNLRPTDVISSLWPQNQEPRLQTKEEAELFFKFFMGLWDNILKQIQDNALVLPKYEQKSDNLYWINLCQQRTEQLEIGYIEGFWGGKEKLNIPVYLAELIDSFSDLAKVYLKIAEHLQSEENIKNLIKTIQNTDKMVNRTFSFIIENTVLPRIAELKKQ